MSADDVRVRLLLSVQRALVGHIGPSLIAACARAADDMVTLTWYLATSVSADEREDLSVAATEVIADFEGNWHVDERYVVVDDQSRPLPCLGEWVFARSSAHL